MSEGLKTATGIGRVRLGMVGGGQGAFIGAVHRIAARLDDHYAFCAGALSSNPQRALASARELGLADDRSYSDYQTMAAAEAAREDGIEAVAIVTPNYVHYEVAKTFLQAGIHVICDKPLTVTSGQSEELIHLAREKQRILAVTYNYSGYPMVRQARAMVAAGELGRIRVIQAEYAQDWMSEDLEASGQKQAAWRTDPAQSGAGGCVGDIGTHAYHLACFVSGLKVESLCAELTSFVEGRRLDDNAQIMLRFDNGARGMLWASQVAPGNENNFQLRIYGEKGGLSWRQEEPNVLIHSPLGESPRRITRGGPGSGEVAARVTRIPAGHPEGYLEAFATIYSEVAAAIRAAREGQPPVNGVLFPVGEDGLKGVRFVEAAVRSSQAGSTWVPL
jgi:predicted dehydrogenase